MTLLIFGYIFGLKNKIRAAFWAYFICSGLIGMIMLTSSTAYGYGNQNFCGDGDVGGSEECDDGNYNNGDGCDYNCNLEDEDDTVVEDDNDTDTDTGSDSANDYTSGPVYQVKGTSIYKNIASEAADLGRVDFSQDNSDHEIYQGKNVFLYQILPNLLQGKDDKSQRVTLQTLIVGITSINAQVLENKYGLYTSGLTKGLQLLLDVQRGKIASVNEYFNGSAGSDQLIKYMTPKSNGPQPKKVIVFMKPQGKQINHIDRHFGAGLMYGCDGSQCSNVPIIYPVEGEYNVRITIRYVDGEVVRETRTITVGGVHHGAADDSEDESSQDSDEDVETESDISDEDESEELTEEITEGEEEGEGEGESEEVTEDEGEDLEPTEGYEGMEEGEHPDV